MKRTKTLRMLSRGYILFSACSLLSVSLMAFFDPQMVMSLVGVQLPNTDAFSSIRGVYGGVGLTLFITLVYTLRKNIQEALMFLMLLWGLYALSRIITIFNEGALGEFGMQWLITESVLFTAALVFFVLNRQPQQTPVAARL